jgi:hypothetical protein
LQREKSVFDEPIYAPPHGEGWCGIARPQRAFVGAAVGSLIEPTMVIS